MSEEEIIKGEAYLDMLKDKARETGELAKENLELRKEIERLNNILDTLEQDMALLNATGIKEIKPKYVFDRISTLRGVDKEC